MSKRLTITYGDVTVHDADVDEFSWTDCDGYVCVTGEVKAVKAAPAAGLLEMLTQASRRKTEAVAKRVTEPIVESVPVAENTESEDDDL